MRYGQAKDILASILGPTPFKLTQQHGRYNLWVKPSHRFSHYTLAATATEGWPELIAILQVQIEKMKKELDSSDKIPAATA